MEKRNRGVIEDEFTKAIIKFEKEYMGRGPIDARTFLVNDMILVRLRGVLTPAETKLAEEMEGQKLVKQARSQLFETSRSILEKMVKEIVGCNILSLHSDISTQTGERIIVLTVDHNFDAK
jgi:uncharacterized protein YbcI